MPSDQSRYILGQEREMAGNTPTFNLKAVIHETRLTPATLRAWERRYDFLKPQRSAGGHRLYSQDEIDMLVWLVARQAEGLSISHAIQMWRDHENSPVSKQRPIYNDLQSYPSGAGTLLQLRNQWTRACLAFDELTAESALSQALALAAPEVVCTELILKGLAEIGQDWYEGAVSVQQEHFASALALRRLNALVAAAPRPTRPERLLAACPPGEAHDLVLLMLTFILRWRGWDVVYLGANVPLSHLDVTVRTTSPRLVLSVAQTLPGTAALRDMAKLLNNQTIPLTFGGGIFLQIPGLAERVPGYYLGNDLHSVPQSIERLLSRTPALPAPLAIPLIYQVALEGLKEKEGLIAASVNATFRDGPISAAHLEEANSHLGRAIISALSLGEISFLNHSITWLNGLLANHNLSSNLAQIYFKAYQQAVDQHLGDQALPVLDWLAGANITS
jgi:MerR family transcriptional regulator, light-induced transcriptional regulator